MSAKKDETIPPAMQAALNANTELKQALQQSTLPMRFQAMVLGLSTLRQMNPNRIPDKIANPDAVPPPHLQ